MASCSHYLANRLDHARARKPGRGRPVVPILERFRGGRYGLEPSHEMTAERLFEQRWATTLLELVMSRFEAEMAAAGKARQFAILRPTLSGSAERGSHARVAAELGLSEQAARAAAHRLRTRFREIIREEIALTVDDPADVEEEIRTLFETLGA